MKLKFDPTLDYQQDAISAVVGVFEGQPLAQSSFEISPVAGNGLEISELGIGNKLTLTDAEILANVHQLQETNNIEKVTGLQGREFSIEMETGTGKTYVYLRTIFELSRHYGLRKFIIVVPSIAIREGVLKNIEITREHFRTLYDNAPFDCFVYDSKRLGKVRQFATSNQVQIMVINIQSFQKDVVNKDTREMTDNELKKLNVINRENDRMSGRRPIEFIQATNPVVIIDEPQSVDNTEKSQHALRNLNPLVTLRYSATHRNPHNLLYRLDPIKAYDLRLVKRIEVASVRSDDNFNDAYVKLLDTDNKKGIRARVEIHQEKNGATRLVRLWVKQGDDLYVKSGKRGLYRDGYIIQNIDCTPGMEYIEFNTGKYLVSGQEIGGLNDEIMKTQVYETVEQHFKKERLLKGKGIKILSLFFIDRVANYRFYNEDNVSELGKIGRWFEAAYREAVTKPIYKNLIPFGATEVHNGYFSQDKRGHVQDTSGKIAADGDTYNLIMRDKERLLDPDEPLRFIFSHSALREGWDNPNVFQICTLNETRSFEKKRQEIGRGLRLPVNCNGERVHDETINRLTVIANESYEAFARTLQREFEDDFGIQFGKINKIAFAKLVRTTSDGIERELGQKTSARIWEELVYSGYLNNVGEIMDKFEPNNPHFRLQTTDEFADLAVAIIDELNKKIFKNRVVDARKRKELVFHKQVHLRADFRALWEKIKQRTRYRVSFNTEDLISRAVKRIKEINFMKTHQITTTIVEVDISEAGVSADRQIAMRSREMKSFQVLLDLLAFLQKETELTRHTLGEILKQSGKLNEFMLNPQTFMSMVAKEISRALHELILEGIQYEKVSGRYWEMKRLERDAERGILRYLNNLYEVQNKSKVLFDAVECDSEVEKKFAQDLDSHDNVKLFLKLPSWFRVETPVGPYNPDWAFVTEQNEKLYFVRETKSTLDSEERRNKENQKIVCGKKHFETLDVDYDVVTSLAEVAI